MTGNNTDSPNVIAPPPLIYLGLVAAGLIIDSFWPWALQIFPLQRVVGIGFVGLGFALSAASVIEFVRHGTHPDPRHPTTKIVETGPFRFSRNPIYVAFALMHLGVGTWTAKAWVLLALPLALLAIRLGVIGPEERYLEARFGEQYLAYKRRVGRWMGRRSA